MNKILISIIITFFGCFFIGIAVMPFNEKLGYVLILSLLMLNILIIKLDVKFLENIKLKKDKKLVRKNKYLKKYKKLSWTYNQVEKALKEVNKYIKNPVKNGLAHIDNIDSMDLKQQSNIMCFLNSHTDKNSDIYDAQENLVDILDSINKFHIDIGYEDIACYFEENWPDWFYLKPIVLNAIDIYIQLDDDTNNISHKSDEEKQNTDDNISDDNDDIDEDDLDKEDYEDNDNNEKNENINSTENAVKTNKLSDDIRIERIILERNRQNVFMKTFNLSMDEFSKLNASDIKMYEQQIEEILQNIANETFKYLYPLGDICKYELTEELKSLMIDEDADIYVAVYFNLGSSVTTRPIGFGSSVSSYIKKDYTYILDLLKIGTDINLETANDIQNVSNEFHYFLYSVYDANNRNYYATDDEYKSDDEIEKIINQHPHYKILSLLCQASMAAYYNRGYDRVKAIQTLEKSVTGLKNYGSKCDIFIYEYSDDELNILAYTQANKDNIDDNIKNIIPSLEQGNKILKI